MKIQVVVATHKEYEVCNDPLYTPVHAGAAVHDYKLPYLTDNTGENISYKNKTYCELTVLYWAWKNIEADYIGLCHYRRYFCNNRSRDILTLEEAEKIVEGTDIILPRKRNYYIETNYSQYEHAHHIEDLNTTRKVISELSGKAYVDAFDARMKRTDGHRFNMFIMNTDLFQEYCEWLFGVLEELEQRIDTSSYDSYNSRVFGFVAERLLDVWIDANKKTYVELPYVFTEKENWIIKGGNFLKRKFFRQRGADNGI